MNQNVMNWRNQKGMPEIEKIIADSYGEAHVKEWEAYRERKQAIEKGKQRRKLKSMLSSLPTDMKQELLAALLSELKGD